MSKTKFHSFLDRAGIVLALLTFIPGAAILHAQQSNPGVQQSGAVSAGDCVEWGPGVGQISSSGVACASSVVSPANPTATAGPSAVNGAAATFMRSDAAPAVQTGTAAQQGIVQVDGTTITETGGVISGASTTFGGQAVAPGGSATVQGNGASIQLSTGTATSGDCVEFDASGNTIAAGSPCAASIASVSAVAGASTTYSAAQNNVLVTRSNAGAAMADTLPGTGGAGVLPSGTIVTVSNIDTGGILSVTVGAGATIKARLALTNFLYICPGQTKAFYSDGSDYYLLSESDVCKFAADTTIFVATTGSNTNDGLTVSTPLLDLQTAWYLAQRNFNANGFNTTIQLANGTYTGRTYLSGLLPGQRTVDYSVSSYTRDSSVLILGDATTPANVVLAGNGIVAAVNVLDSARLVLRGVKVTNTSSYGIMVAGAWLSFVNIDFGTTSSIHFAALTEANIKAYTPYTISAGSGCHFIAGQGGYIQMLGVPSTPGVITLTGTPAFASGFACAQSNGSVEVGVANTFSGSATGPRYSGSLNGTINSGGGGASYFPGNAAGSVSTGAQYQ